MRGHGAQSTHRRQGNTLRLSNHPTLLLPETPAPIRPVHDRSLVGATLVVALPAHLPHTRAHSQHRKERMSGKVVRQTAPRRVVCTVNERSPLVNPAPGIIQSPPTALPTPGQVLNEPERGWTRLNDPEQPEHPIPSKTQEIACFSPQNLFSAEHPTPTAKRPPGTSPRPARSRTKPTNIRQTDLNDPERGWTRLNDPERPEHPIPRKTLEIACFSPQNLFSAEHLNADVNLFLL